MNIVGAWTPEAVTFQIFFMSKRKNLDPLGGRASGTPPMLIPKELHKIIPNGIIAFDRCSGPREMLMTKSFAFGRTY